MSGTFFPARCKACLTNGEEPAILYVKEALQKGDTMDNRIREFREERGMTQQEMARQTGVSRQTIISLENGRYNPSILLAFRIARLFGQPLEEIFIYREETEG